MVRFFAIVCFSFLLFSCKDEKASLSGNEPVDIEDFLAAFPDLKVPYKIADTNMVKVADTTNISYIVFSGFVPDSSLTTLLGKNVNKSKIRPVGKITKQEETYLLVDFTQNKKTILATFLLDKKAVYKGGMVLLKQDVKDGYAHGVNITSEPTFIISKEKIKGNELSYTRNGYAFNNGSAEFITVMNDSNEDLKRINEIINPIDTLARENKLSGDYIQDKKNYISVRDGSSENKHLFFIHFEKNDGECVGELKGVMTMQDATHGYFQESGDPCVIDFSFGTNNITVKERGNCGNHRGIKCFFNDTYRKKKEPKATDTKKKKGK